MSAPDNSIVGLLLRAEAAEKRMGELEEERRSLQRQLTFQSENNHKRNLQLDALHFVWCTGGCASGVHRYDHGELTQEIVDAAILNTGRLVSWWRNKGFKAEWKDLSAENKGLWYKSVYRARELEAELAALRAKPARAEAGERRVFLGTIDHDREDGYIIHDGAHIIDAPVGDLLLGGLEGKRVRLTVEVLPEPKEAM